MSDALRAALKSLGGSATLMEQQEAVSSLLVYARNLVEFPHEEKYRRVRVSNIHFYERLGHLEDEHGLMSALGFLTDGDYMAWDEARPPADAAVAADLKAAVDALAEREAALAADFARLPPRLDEEGHAFVSVQGGASHCDQGKRHNMEDDEILVDSFMGAPACGFFGLYDGHGGRETVDFVVKAMHLNLEKLLAAEPGMDMKQAFSRAYAATDGQVRRANILQSGTTAVTCLIREEPGSGARTLHSANVGDSRAILVRGGKAVRLTIDHKPSLPEEEKRIKDSGGFVIDRRVNGVLAISRALGDFMLKSNDVVSHVPYCQTVPLAAGDSYLILACDGVWDVLADQQAVDFVLEQIGDAADNASGPALNAVLKRACHALVDEALARKSMDNVTAMIIKL